MKDDIDVLFERREELRQNIEKMQKEYSALGRIICKAMDAIQKEREEDTIAKLQTQINEQTRNGRTEVYVDNKDLSYISGTNMSDGKSYVDAKELKKMIDEYER